MIKSASSDDIAQLEVNHFGIMLKTSMRMKKTNGCLIASAVCESLSLQRDFSIINTTLHAMILELTRRFK